MKEKQKKKKKNHVLIRLNILFFAVFILFSALILRLGVIQIVQGEEYKRQVEQTDEISVNHSVPRGEIYDRNYEKVAYNVPQKAITFTPPKNPQPDDLLESAENLAKLIDMGKEKENVPEWVKKEIWILQNDNGGEKVTEEETKALEDKELYRLKLDRITEEEMDEVDLNVAAIYRKLAGAIALTPTIVKNEGVTDEEYAVVSENLANLPGVDITTDWQRAYTYEDSFFLLGQVSTSEEGLPADKVEYYTSKGYNLNDRVGKSYIEEMLEDVLQGQKAVVKNVTNKNGEVVDTEVITEGKSGYDVVLTIDMELQAEVEKIIEEEMLEMIKSPAARTLENAFVVVMNPKTGEVLSLAGRQYDWESKGFRDFSRGTFTAAFEPGSSIKGATVLMGYETGAISLSNNVMTDEIMRFKGGISISSVNGPWGSINDLTGLERSSNVYMAKIALRIAGGRYIPGGPLQLDVNKLYDMRKYFSQFGLGAHTGIGFSNEAVGIQRQPDPTQPGQLLYFAFGQLDTYTPIQLAQYVSTIANDGYRMKPQLVKEIRQPQSDDELGTIVEELHPVVLNRIDMDDQYIKRVQEGLWRVTHGSRGTARGYFRNEPYDAAGKTGTAQAYKNGRETENLTFVGYAPFDDPEIALAVVVPNAHLASHRAPRSINNIIAQRVFRTYFELKEKRNNDASSEFADGGNQENLSNQENEDHEAEKPSAEENE